MRIKSCIFLGALLFYGVVHADGWHQDKRRKFEVKVPDGWSVESFEIGTLALRIQASAENNIHGVLVANCNFTAVPWESPRKSQKWLDKNVNVKPFDSKYLAEFRDQLGLISEVLMLGPAEGELGSYKAYGVVYMSRFFSKPTSNYLYQDTIYLMRRRPSDVFGVTCMGGGLSQTAARASFERYSNQMTGILKSIRFVE